MFWTAEKDDELRQLRAAGKTRDQIAAEMTRTAGIVITPEAIRCRLKLIIAPLGAPDNSAIIAKAKQLKAEGASWQAVGRACGLNPNTIRSWVDPEFAERYRAKALARKERASVAGFQPREFVQFVSESSEPRNPVYDPKRDGVRLPESLTGILMGDPFPGRDKFMGRAGWAQ